MAKGYWNISGGISNPEGMDPYLQAVKPYLAKLNARFFFAERLIRMSAKAMLDLLL